LEINKQVRYVDNLGNEVIREVINPNLGQSGQPLSGTTGSVNQAYGNLGRKL